MFFILTKLNLQWKSRCGEVAEMPAHLGKEALTSLRVREQSALPSAPISPEAGGHVFRPQSGTLVVVLPRVAEAHAHGQEE